ncbi:MAG: hypothetical protein AVDCRST_MAG89-5250, partial [uncultured Gemmatimonadetes bacterium]
EEFRRWAVRGRRRRGVRGHCPGPDLCGLPLVGPRLLLRRARRLSGGCRFVRRRGRVQPLGPAGRVRRPQRDLGRREGGRRGLREPERAVRGRGF